MTLIVNILIMACWRWVISHFENIRTRVEKSDFVLDSSTIDNYPPLSEISRILHEIHGEYGFLDTLDKLPWLFPCAVSLAKVVQNPLPLLTRTAECQ